MIEKVQMILTLTYNFKKIEKSVYNSRKYSYAKSLLSILVHLHIIELSLI